MRLVQLFGKSILNKGEMQISNVIITFWKLLIHGQPSPAFKAYKAGVELIKS